MDYDFFMETALQEAELAYGEREIPIGCVIVYKNEIIARTHNQRNIKHNSLYHAELIAINQACGYLNDWRLEGCSLFVTLEPCPMCAGAIVQARISELVIGAKNKKAGCAGSILNIVNEPRFNHQVKLTENILVDKCSNLISNFFSELRGV